MICYVACSHVGNIDIVKVLLNASIDVNLVDKYGDTAFDVWYVSPYEE